MRILIVDDEPLIAADIEMTLLDAGHQVVANAQHLSTALEALERHPADFAILDANLGGKSAEPIADDLKRRGIPYMILTGYTRDQIGPWAKDSVVIGKPVTAEMLLAHLPAQAALN
ncbi:response regulator [Novosphingopyxis sp.]|uniref:response regulator n=1 Tax=Novosphingopyxis sp. TaxID=2709690 RepID=UPI003B5B03C5